VTLGAEAAAEFSLERQTATPRMGHERNRSLLFRPCSTIRSAETMTVERKYIAIEGPIGVGQSTLSHILAERMGARLLLEPVEENPFLPDFYRDPVHYAFQTQLFFLLTRFQQQADIMQDDLFARGGVVSDYVLIKDRIFAAINLSEQEMMLYDRLWKILGPRAPKPDLVILLLARVDVLLERIEKRSRPYEKAISPEYLAEIIKYYTEYFFDYDDCPLLVLDTSDIDIVNNEKDLDDVLAVIREHRGGVRHYKPLGSRS
jgi:deoxyadenosine/deoxycytidine kinase